MSETNLEPLSLSSRIAVLADVQSLFFVAKNSAQSKIEYNRLLSGLANHRPVVRAIAYVSQRPGASGFNEALMRAGYEVRVKELPTRDADPFAKWSWIAGICVDALKLASRVDALVIASADPALVPLIEAVRAVGCRVEIASIREATSPDLIAAANVFIPIQSAWMFREPKFTATTTPAANPSMRSSSRYEGLPDDRELDAEAAALAARQQID